MDVRAGSRGRPRRGSSDKRNCFICEQDITEKYPGFEAAPRFEKDIESWQAPRTFNIEVTQEGVAELWPNVVGLLSYPARIPVCRRHCGDWQRFALPASSAKPPAPTQEDCGANGTNGPCSNVILQGGKKNYKRVREDEGLAFFGFEPGSYPEGKRICTTCYWRWRRQKEHCSQSHVCPVPVPGHGRCGIVSGPSCSFRPVHGGASLILCVPGGTAVCPAHAKYAAGIWSLLRTSQPLFGSAAAGGLSPEERLTVDEFIDRVVSQSLLLVDKYSPIRFLSSFDRLKEYKADAFYQHGLRVAPDLMRLLGAMVRTPHDAANKRNTFDAKLYKSLLHVVQIMHTRNQQLNDLQKFLSIFFYVRKVKYADVACLSNLDLAVSESEVRRILDEVADSGYRRAFIVRHEFMMVFDNLDITLSGTVRHFTLSWVKRLQRVSAAPAAPAAVQTAPHEQLPSAFLPSRQDRDQVRSKLRGQCTRVLLDMKKGRREWAAWSEIAEALPPTQPPVADEWHVLPMCEQSPATVKGQARFLKDAFRFAGLDHADTVLAAGDHVSVATLQKTQQILAADEDGHFRGIRRCIGLFHYYWKGVLGPIVRMFPELLEFAQLYLKRKFKKDLCNSFNEYDVVITEFFGAMLEAALETFIADNGLTADLTPAEISDRFVRHMYQQLANVPAAKASTSESFHAFKFLELAFHYVLLRDAIRQNDGDMIVTCLRMNLPYIQLCGQGAYVRNVLEFLNLLNTSPPALRDLIVRNLTVNISGKPNGGMALDLRTEHLVRLAKSLFRSGQLTQDHLGRLSAALAYFEDVCSTMEELTRRPGQRSRHFDEDNSENIALTVRKLVARRLFSGTEPVETPRPFTQSAFPAIHERVSEFILSLRPAPPRTMPAPLPVPPAPNPPPPPAAPASPGVAAAAVGDVTLNDEEIGTLFVHRLRFAHHPFRPAVSADEVDRHTFGPETDENNDADVLHE